MDCASAADTNRLKMLARGVLMALVTGASLQPCEILMKPGKAVSPWDTNVCALLPSPHSSSSERRRGPLPWLSSLKKELYFGLPSETQVIHWFSLVLGHPTGPSLSLLLSHTCTNISPPTLTQSPSSLVTVMPLHLLLCVHRRVNPMKSYLTKEA